MDDDEAFGPAYFDAAQMEEVECVKTLQTAKDAGDLSYFSLAAGRPSRHMDPFVITVPLQVRHRISLTATRVKSGSMVWRAASKSNTATMSLSSTPARLSIMIRSFRIRYGHMTDRM